MQKDTNLSVVPYWMRGFLLMASIYNLIWAAFIYWFPDSFFMWVTQRPGPAPLIISWQAIGIFVFSVCYFISALYPVRFRYLVALGVFSKVAGGLWFYFHIMEQTINKKFLFHLIINDLAWVPLLLIISVKLFNVARR